MDNLLSLSFVLSRDFHFGIPGVGAVGFAEVQRLALVRLTGFLRSSTSSVVETSSQMLFIRRLPEVISVFRLGSFGREPGRSASGGAALPWLEATLRGGESHYPVK